MKRATSPRIWISRPALSSGRTLLGCGALLLLGLAGFWSVRLAWADHLSRSSRLADRERAIKLVSSATLYIRLAERREELGGESLPDLRKAAALDPANAQWRIRLGLRAEWAGDLGLAEASLLDAARLSNLYQPRYLLAQYYFRRQNADLFWRWSQAALETAYGDIGPLLALIWNMRPDADWFARQAPTGRPEIARQYLMLLMKQPPSDATHGLAVRLAGDAKDGDLPVLLDYVDRRILARNGREAVEVWNALCRRKLLPGNPLVPEGGLSLTDAEFRFPPSARGFDWRVQRGPWLRYERVAAGARLTLSGSQPESCNILSQYVPLVPGVRYRLKVDLVSAGESGEDSLDWIVWNSPGVALPLEREAAGWRTFIAPSDVVEIIFAYRRPLGSARLAGTVGIRAVHLEMVR